MPSLRFSALFLPLFFLLIPLRIQADESSDALGAPLGREAELARLHALPPSHIPFRAASLGSAIRLLAESAQMSYLAPTDGDFTERVTSDVRINPFVLLQILSENYNFAFEYKQGVWRFYRINLNELVSKSYTLRFNNLSKVSITSSSISGQLNGMSGMSGMSGGMGGGSGGGGGGGHAGGGGSAFSVKTSQVIDDIRKILGIPTSGVRTPSLDGSPALPGAEAAAKSVDAPKIEPIWSADTSQLFVVATRQQHSLIEAYLKTVDRPQKLIRVAVKFVETSRNPTQALGVDWSQTFLGSGGPITLSGAATNTTASAVSNAGATTISAANGAGTLSTPINLNHPGNLLLPTTLLSAPAFQFTAQAIASDKFSSIVQDPVIYTSNNREVSFQDTSQLPVQQGSTTIGAATAATTSQIAYIDVGTEVAILPTILPGEGDGRQLIQLNLSINVSSITGQQIINGNPYPITSSRTYTYTVVVPKGDTLAIAGLEQRSRQTTDNKVPIFGDIPVIGFAFKNQNDSVIHTSLLAFITPDLVDAEGNGDTADTLPLFQHRVFAGRNDETLAQINQSLRGLPEDISALVTAARRQNRALVLNRFDQIEVELSLIDVRLGELRLSDKLTAPTNHILSADRDRLDAARAAVSRLRKD